MLAVVMPSSAINLENRGMVKLAEFVAREVGVSTDNIMLLRHSSSGVEHLKTLGVTVQDYTIVQPIGSRYDYRDPRRVRIDIVAVLVDNQVHAVYRILGVEKEGTTYSLNVPALTLDDKKKSRSDRPARRFRIVEIKSAATGKTITGWERRQRTPVQRSNDKFFYEIGVDVTDTSQSENDIRDELEKRVRQSMQDSPRERRKRLTNAAKVPRKFEVRSIAFDRSPDVIAEVLARAKGHCEICRHPAPFTRKKDGSPYLEVHHRIRLADNGEDTVRNAHALCPNCHRHEHYG
ncbi:MAG: HNH endonuclease [Rudaea sp.]